MENNKCAIFTDLHLGVHQNSSTWHKIGLDWADWFISDLKERNIKKIIFTGDFFHSRSEISVNTIYVASELIKKFIDFELHMIVGNHDSYYKQKADVHSLSIFGGYNNITVYDTTQIVSINGKKVCFCPWGFEYSKITDTDIIFGHFEIESFKMNAHKLCEVGVKPKQLLEKAPIIFSGHFHLNEEREYDKGKIIYIGSPFQLDFGERDCKKGYYILDFNDLSYEFIENKNSPIHKKILISDIIHDNKLKDDYKELIKHNFIRLVIDENIDQNIIDNTIHTINSLTPLNLTVDPLINFENLDQTDADLSGIDMTKAIVEFVNLLDIKEKEEVIKRTLYLYNQVKHD